MIDIFSKLEELKRQNKSFTLCIITETQGSTPRKAGSRMIVTSSKELYGTIGGGSIEKQVIDEAFELLSQDKPMAEPKWGRDYTPKFRALSLPNWV